MGSLRSPLIGCATHIFNGFMVYNILPVQGRVADARGNEGVAPPTASAMSLRLWGGNVLVAAESTAFYLVKSLNR